jgi:glycosyltransferase involved in cell wall biosynthesis
MQNKPKLLIWSDFFLAGTGFGTVSKYVINSLKNHFDIDQLAINYNGEFFDTKSWPIQVSAAKLLNPQDPYGNQMFVNAIQSGKYDYVWIMNDTFVVEKVAQELPKLFDLMKSHKQKIPVIVYYYPVDCQIISGATSMLEVADHVVAYCDFGKQETLSKLPHLESRLSVITHGVDTSSFKKIDPIERKLLRSKMLKVDDDETFLWINVNRNSARKDIAKSILAFSEFKKQVPNSKLYLHTAIKDTNIDLNVAVQHLGLSIKTDVIFPANYSPAKPYPVEILNGLYNCADAFITTTYGEGWGLTHLDAACVGIPIVAPQNTCFPEQLGNGTRGFMYPCKEKTWVDNSGYRPTGQLEDIVQTMNSCYQSVKTGQAQEVTSLAKKYVDTITWDKIGQQWINLFRRVKHKPLKSITGVSL